MSTQNHATSDSPKTAKNGSLNCLRKWHTLVERLGVDFPLSGYHKMPSEDIRKVAESWASHLAGIPIERADDVYAATIVGTRYAPSVTDFLSTWRTIQTDEAKAYQNEEWRRHDEEKRAAIADDGTAGRNEIPEFVRQHREYLRRTGHGITCHCKDKNGRALPAYLDGNEFSKEWICRTRSCDFRLNALQVIEHLDQQTKKGGAKSAATAAAPVHSDRSAATPSAQSLRQSPQTEAELADALLDYIGFDAEKTPRELWTAFGWWLLERHPVMRWTPELAHALWIEWQEENAARAEAMQEATQGKVAAEYSDDELLIALAQQCNLGKKFIEGTPEQAVSFARFLLRHQIPDVWTADLAREQWVEWIAETHTVEQIAA